MVRAVGVGRRSSSGPGGSAENIHRHGDAAFSRFVRAERDVGASARSSSAAILYLETVPGHPAALFPVLLDVSVLLKVRRRPGRRRGGPEVRTGVRSSRTTG